MRGAEANYEHNSDTLNMTTDSCICTDAAHSTMVAFITVMPWLCFWPTYSFSLWLSLYSIHLLLKETSHSIQVNLKQNIVGKFYSCFVAEFMFKKQDSSLHSLHVH